MKEGRLWWYWYSSSIRNFKESSVISGDSFCLGLVSRTVAERFLRDSWNKRSPELTSADTSIYSSLSPQFLVPDHLNFLGGHQKQHNQQPTKNNTTTNKKQHNNQPRTSSMSNVSPSLMGLHPAPQVAIAAASLRNCNITCAQDEALKLLTGMQSMAAW